jgi:hypothetical protein
LGEEREEEWWWCVERTRRGTKKMMHEGVKGVQEESRESAKHAEGKAQTTGRPMESLCRELFATT